jgi:hypothetical protein
MRILRVGPVLLTVALVAAACGGGTEEPSGEQNVAPATHGVCLQG